MARKKGSSTRGYYYRTGRGWYLTNGGNSNALRDEHGQAITAERTPDRVLREAYHRWLSQQPVSFTSVPVSTPIPASVPKLGVMVSTVCQLYLDSVKSKSIDGESNGTYEMRSNSLFDFCTGFPAKYRVNHVNATKSEKEAERIHKGYGDLPYHELKKIHVSQWVQAHNWNGGVRPHLQALKRAFNYCVENDVIEKNPIKGYPVPKGNSRLTYITPEQENACYVVANKQLGLAIHVCIRTGARYGCEFAALKDENVFDEGKRMTWEWPSGTKVKGKPRKIMITDPEIIEIVRDQLSKHGGHVFRNTQGNPWTEEALKSAFARLIKSKKTKKLGVNFRKGTCMYSCRHTYAKRILSGYWNGGKPTNIEVLAKLMGNTPEEARKYAAWDQTYTEPLWDAC